MKGDRATVLLSSPKKIDWCNLLAIGLSIEGVYASGHPIETQGKQARVANLAINLPVPELTV